MFRRIPSVQRFEETLRPNARHQSHGEMHVRQIFIHQTFHQQAHRKTRRIPRIQVCAFIFNDKLHFTYLHQTLFRCKECNKPFASRKALQVHSYVHMPKDQYSHVCSHCAKRFPTAFALNIHEKTHLPKELRYTYPCDICGVK